MHSKPINQHAVAPHLLQPSNAHTRKSYYCMKLKTRDKANFLPSQMFTLKSGIQEGAKLLPEQPLNVATARHPL